VIVSDLSADCLQAGVTQEALSQVCTNIRREATTDNPFLPPTGEILRRVKDFMKYVNAPKVISRETLPKPKAEKADVVPWAYKTWGEFTPSDKAGLQKHLSEMDQEKALDCRKYLHTFAGAPHPSREWF